MALENYESIVYFIEMPCTRHATALLLPKQYLRIYLDTARIALQLSIIITLHACSFLFKYRPTGLKRHEGG
jgi:hypothetical protein